MGIKERIKGMPWLGIGVSIALFVLFVMLYFQALNNQKLMAFKSSRAGLAASMQLSLTKAAEAEKSAVLAITDEESRIYAGRNRTAMAELEKECLLLGGLLEKNGTKDEREYLAQFSKLFIELRDINNELMKLAVRNSNLKAYGLEFGPAADALKDMDAGLNKIIQADAREKGAGKAAVPAYSAQASAWRMQALFSPHIAEKSSEKMDELEALMDKEDKKVREELSKLASMPGMSDSEGFTEASSAYDRFSGIRKQIISYSRENTNVESVSLSLGKNQKILSLCRDTLSALQTAIQDEPESDANYVPAENPLVPAAKK
jgi:hypothetical protein